MDASALLRAQGWRGKGFSLHPSDNSIGLAKPLLISRNTDGRGIGQKPHVTSDQWWLHAFDQKLKGLDTSKKGAVTQSVTKGQLDVVVATGKSGKYMGVSGLYSSFVSGGLLVGTDMTPPATEAGTSTDVTPMSSSSEGDSAASGNKKSRKSSREGETRAERRMRREARRLRKAQKAAKKAAAEKVGKKRSAEKVAKKEAKRARRDVESKEDRRARKIERRARKEAKRSRREAAQPKG